MSDEDLSNAGSGNEDKDQEKDLTKEEEAKWWETFTAFDYDSTSGYIDANELCIVLEMMGQKTTEEEIFRMIVEADDEIIRRITYAQFKPAIAEQKKNQSLTNEVDTLDAFVAMGGQPNGKGYIDAEKLIRIIKKEFEMTIDIEKLINDIHEDGQGKIKYDEFKNILSSSY